MNKLETIGLKVAYGQGKARFTAVDCVDFTIPEGKTLGLVGESGCGKSTIARALVGVASVIDGRVLFDGVDHTSRRARNSVGYRRKVQMVFQDPYSSLNPRMTVDEMLGEALRLRGLTRDSREDKVRILALVGMGPQMLSRFPFQFSGGQRQRLAIARALAVGPELIISDEITSALDVSAQATILNLLKELQRELHLSYLFISHDLSVVRYMADTVAVMYLGRIIENASVDDLFARPQHPYTRALIASIPRIHGGQTVTPTVGDLPDPHNPPQGCRFHPRCKVGPISNPERGICREQDPTTSAVRREHLAACHFAPLAPPPVSQQIVDRIERAQQLPPLSNGHSANRQPSIPPSDPGTDAKRPDSP